MKRVTFKILCFIKRGRITKNGESPVYVRITINGQRCDTSISLKVHPDKWNALAEKSIGTERIDAEVNARIDTIRLRMMQIHRQMELDNIDINPKKIIDAYLGRDRKEENKVTLLGIFREHNDKCHKLSGKDMSPATVERYETCYKHTATFIKLNYKLDDIALEEVNHKFITDYEFYLKTERDCSHNTTTKYLKNFKKIIRIALANELITKDPFANIKFTLQEVERDFLEDHEIHKILNKDFPIERLGFVRDAFIFCCYANLEDKKQRKENQGNELMVRKERPLVALSV